MSKLEVMCARALQVPVNHLLAAFTHDSGHEAEINYDTLGGLQARIADGETADVLILSAPILERMERAGSLVPGSRVDLGRTAVGVAVRDGAPVPDISTADAFKAALLAARSVAFSDPAVGGSAAVHLPTVFERLGIVEEIGRKAMPQRSGAEVARRVAEGTAAIGMTMLAEIVPIEGARVVGPLPPPLGNEVTYTAAVANTSGDRDAAIAFIRALARSEVRAVWQRAGFEC